MSPGRFDDTMARAARLITQAKNKASAAPKRARVEIRFPVGLLYSASSVVSMNLGLSAVSKSNPSSKSDRESLGVFSRSPAAIKLKTMSPMWDVDVTPQWHRTFPASEP